MLTFIVFLLVMGNYLLSFIGNVNFINYDFQKNIFQKKKLLFYLKNKKAYF